MNNNDEMLIISGTIGLSIYENKDMNKKVFLFYDDHSNNSYYENNYDKQHKFISELFDSFVENTDKVSLVLEEPFIDKDTSFKVLWENSKHLTLFRKFYGKLMNKCSKQAICRMYPIDIRIPLFDLSPDQIIFNLENPDPMYNINLKEYFNRIYYLFDFDDINEQYDQTSMIVFIKKVLNTYKSSLFYRKLKERFIYFNDKFILPNKNITIYKMLLKCSKEPNSYNFTYIPGYPIEIDMDFDNSFIDEISKLSSGIMELYMLIITLYVSKKNIIIYAGFYHSHNMAYILEKSYKFKLVYSTGFTNNVHTIYEKSDNKNCIHIDKKYLNFLK
jgi:hypothetical protein